MVRIGRSSAPRHSRLADHRERAAVRRHRAAAVVRPYTLVTGPDALAARNGARWGTSWRVVTLLPILTN